MFWLEGRRSRCGAALSLHESRLLPPACVAEWLLTPSPSQSHKYGKHNKSGGAHGVAEKTRWQPAGSARRLAGSGRLAGQVGAQRPRISRTAFFTSSLLAAAGSNTYLRQGREGSRVGRGRVARSQGTPGTAG